MRYDYVPCAVLRLLHPAYCDLTQFLLQVLFGGITRIVHITPIIRIVPMSTDCSNLRIVTGSYNMDFAALKKAHPQMPVGGEGGALPWET